MNDSRPLPPGWITQWDANYQRYFFVDTSTGQSSWNDPRGPLPNAPSSQLPPAYGVGAAAGGPPNYSQQAPAQNFAPTPEQYQSYQQQQQPPQYQQNVPPGGSDDRGLGKLAMGAAGIYALSSVLKPQHGHSGGGLGGLGALLGGGGGHGGGGYGGHGYGHGPSHGSSGFGGGGMLPGMALGMGGMALMGGMGGRKHKRYGRKHKGWGKSKGWGKHKGWGMGKWKGGKGFGKWK
ncbi:uncharacterized protein EV422DRAFT_563681 [Fimicolochytrium jonesii]|uniref:uncharacterized protein n=1 Tax=Fimicolochytrium jonesii TaxID=1396493 RepID=UPI0022FE640D|nr:uncharacterized protein EV422DRAFT_563681 [Fimicolochytrium jonesii]KAI8825852.1 hypothetical protein EV422DRAFT_563681 [Fimicolochytrium jonesii]